MVAAVLALSIGVLAVATGGLNRVGAAVGGTVEGLLADLTATPVPSAAPIDVSDAPTLEAPEEPYTNQPAVDIAGTIPAAAVGLTDSVVRLYVAIGDGEPGTVGEVTIGTAPRFVFPGVPLSKGANTFTATIIGPTDLESEASSAVVYVFDTSKPKVTITSPADNGVVNARSVNVKGTTQGRSALSARNVTTNATVTGAADGKGAFSLVVPIGKGANTIEVTATDPAGNVNKGTVTVRRGSGTLTASLAASFYRIKRSQLPEPVQLSVVVTNPDGERVADAEATFTIAVPGIPAITSSSIQTSARGSAAFTTTIPKGADVGQVSVTVIVRTRDFGNVTDRTVITIESSP